MAYHLFYAMYLFSFPAQSIIYLLELVCDIALYFPLSCQIFSIKSSIVTTLLTQCFMITLCRLSVFHSQIPQQTTLLSQHFTMVLRRVVCFHSFCFAFSLFFCLDNHTPFSFLSFSYFRLSEISTHDNVKNGSSFFSEIFMYLR